MGVTGLMAKGPRRGAATGTGESCWNPQIFQDGTVSDSAVNTLMFFETREGGTQRWIKDRQGCS